MTNKEPTPNTDSVDAELPAQIRKIHERLHGRRDTHKQVAKHAHWTGEELNNVLDEDDMLFEQEIMQLLTQARKEPTDEYYIRCKAPDGTPIVFEGKEAFDFFIDGWLRDMYERGKLEPAQAHKGYAPSFCVFKDAAEIGAYIRHARRAADITQQQLADKTGLSRTVIANIEGGNRDDIGYLELAKILGVIKPATPKLYTQADVDQAVAEARQQEHNLVFTKSGELDEADFAEWSLERLKELGLDEPMD